MSRETMERLEFLLAMRATGELSTSEADECTQLLEAHPFVDEDGYDLAAAALLADAIVEEPLPAALRARLVAEGEALVGQPTEMPKVAEFPPKPDQHRGQKTERPQSALLGWLAAAACLMLAVAAWWPRLTAPATEVVTREAPAPVIQPPTPAEQRAALVAEGNTQTLAWTATEDPAAAGAAGDVVWSSSRQQGFMRISRLEVNDPTATQYQLWIFDRTRDERYPVDGGVFDMPAGVTEAVVPINAKVLVNDPHLFAVTVEAPGGVVVSDRERIVLVAQTAS